MVALFGVNLNESGQQTTVSTDRLYRVPVTTITVLYKGIYKTDEFIIRESRNLPDVLPPTVNVETVTPAASLEPTDPTSLLPLSSATADAATLHAISIQAMTSEPENPLLSQENMETEVAKRATYFIAQSTSVMAYNRTVEKFMTLCPETPEGMRTPAEPTFITLPPPIDYSKITPMVITLGTTPTHTPTLTPTQ